MKLFSEEVQQTSTNSSHNILSVENFSEIFFDVFEIEINKSKYPVEKISDYEGNPVVSVPVLVGEAEIFYPFILVKGNFNVVFNENNTLDVLYPDGEFLTIKEKVAPAVEEELPLIDVVENLKIEVDDLSESKSKILEQIERAKREAERTIKESEKLKLSKISKENDKKEKLFSESLDIAREKLVHEFLSISDKIKEDIVKEFSGNYIDLKENIDHKLGDICQDLNKQLQENFTDASNIFDNKIKSLVKELYLETVTPRVDNELKEIAIQIVDKVNEIESSLDKKLDVKAEKTLVEGVSKELLVIQKANIELNDSITKGVNKALSRAGNAKAFAEKIDQEIKEKISTDLLYIETYFDEKLKTIQEKTFDITEDSRKYIIDIVNKTKGELLEEIRKLPTEKPVEYIIESKKDSSEKVSVDKLKKEYDRVIHDKFENYKTDLRRYIAVYSGGGSVAQQFAAGGTIGGDLVIVGSISASQYLGIPSSGGGSDVSGLSSNWENAYTTVQSNSANWETSYSNLSTKANLNGGNTFTGNQAISGNLSATGINATGSLYVASSAVFSSAIRPTSNGTGTPLSSSLMTRADVDSRVWQPAMIQGMTAWWSANDLLVQGTATPTNGSLVTTWRSKKGDLTVTQANSAYKPVFKTNIQNGLPGVLFDGVDDYLQTPTTPIFPNLASPNQRTIFIVCRPNALVSTGGGITYQRPQIFGNNASSNGVSVSPSASNNIFTVWDYDSISSVNASTTSIAPSATVLITTRHLDGVTSVSLNQATPVTKSVLRECLSNTQLQFGWGGSYAAFFTGYLFDILFYNRGLTNDEILVVETALKLRYNI